MATEGNITEEVVRAYIEEQKKNRKEKTEDSSIL